MENITIQTIIPFRNIVDSNADSLLEDLSLLTITPLSGIEPLDVEDIGVGGAITTSPDQKHIDSQIDLLYLNLIDFYKIPENLTKFRNIIDGNTPHISLRLIDWFSTNYAKKYYTNYILTKTGTRFKVFNSYKSKLRAYGKTNFDAFSRGKRIIAPPLGNGESTMTEKETTIGQMNFFKWAIENQVIEYILENIDTIKKDMDSRSSTSKKKKEFIDDNSKTRKKREELSVSASKCIIKETVSITIKFTL